MKNEIHFPCFSVIFLILIICLCSCAGPRVHSHPPATSTAGDFHGTFQEGIASWYGKKFHHRQTANQEIYNMYRLTAAHQTLPFHTRVRVTNLSNGRSVVVRINDRGPFAKGRIIDLSYKAAQALDMVDSGTAPVRLQILRYPQGFTRSEPSSPTVRHPRELPSLIQAGAFQNRSNALRRLRTVRRLLPSYPFEILRTGEIFRIILSDPISASQEEEILRTLKKAGIQAFRRSRSPSVFPLFPVV